jgi:hypothetical protein
MHALGRDLFFIGNVEELAQGIFGLRSARAANAKVAAATTDLDIETRFEQAQVFVERSAEICESQVVRRIEIEFARLRV